jgi:hypothetical protein
MKILKQIKTSRIVLRVTDFEKNQLDRIAFNENKTIAQIVRRSLNNDNVFNVKKQKESQSKYKEVQLIILLVDAITRSEEKPVLVDAQQILSIVCDLWDIDLGSPEIRKAVETYLKKKHNL